MSPTQKKIEKQYKRNKIHLNYFKILKKYIFFVLLISKFAAIYCDDNDNDKDSGKKTKILFILLIVVFAVVIVILIIFFIYMCCKKRRQNNRNNFIESTNYLERGSPEEINLRERINNNGPKELSNYLIDKLVCDTYNKNFELLGNQCPICLENFEENKTKIIMGRCLHIFHEKCLGDFAEKIDLNKSIFAQFVCPSCRNNLIDDADKIKECLKKFPNFFEEMHNNKKITKIKHMKNLIDIIISGKDNNSKDNIKKNSIVKINNNNETDRKNIKEENKDISYNNKNGSKEKITSRTSLKINEEKNEINDVENNIETL